MPSGHIRVRAEARLQVVFSEDPQAHAIVVSARRNRSKGRREIDPFERQFVAGVEEVGDGDSLSTFWRAHHTMRRGLEVAVGGGLKHLPEVHQIRTRSRWRIDELVAHPNLQAADFVLQDEGEEAGVGVQTDALIVGRASRWGRIPDDLEVSIALG